MTRLRSLCRCAVTALMVCAASVCASAAEPSDSVAAASVSPDSVGRSSFIKKIISYFDNSNKPKKDPKAFDIGVIGGPYYSSEIKLGLGVVASGSYRLGGYDSLVPPSVVAVSAKVSTSGFFSVGLHGTNIFPGDRFRIGYEADFSYKPTDYWGIGYEMASDDANKSRFTDVDIIASVEGLVRIGRHLYIGPSLRLSHVSARHTSDSLMWVGQPTRLTSFGAGLTCWFDTRDNLTAPTRGVFVSLEQICMPRFLGNGDWSMSYTELTASAYQKVWRGGVLAERVHGRWAYGNVPWSMMSTFGGSSDMRGYYEGQYRDKTEMDLTVELRQHVWRRNSLALWVGAAGIAPDTGGMRMSRILPNAGIGYRWEFKKNSNVRIDFGVGRHTTGFVFSINEAF